MFTPQEIQERSDNLERAVFGGYSMSAVEELLRPLQQDYTALYKENAVLKSKMKVLVEKLEEYREQESSMNRAILTAQKTADEILADAERKRAQMTQEAEQRLRQRREDLQKELAQENERAQKAKEEIQLQIEQETGEASRKRAALQKKIAAEGVRVVMAKKAAASFIVELEDLVQQQLSQLERLKQMDLTVKETEEPEKPRKDPVKLSQPAPAQKPEETRTLPGEPFTAGAEAQVEETPPQVLSESEMSEQIRENLSRIFAAGQEDPDKAGKKAGPDSDAASGSTRVMEPVS